MHTKENCFFFCLTVYTLCFVWSFQKLELAKNKIRSMDGLQGHKYLEIIDLEENEVMYLFVYYYFIFLFYFIISKF